MTRFLATLLVTYYGYQMTSCQGTGCKTERIVMESTLRALLRLHIEAVWGVRLPAITQNTIELLREGVQPAWKLYVAEMDGEQVAIWRPDVPAPERKALLACARKALAAPPTEHIAPHISREVVLQQVASPAISIEAAQHVARLLTPDDRTLVDNFEPGRSEEHTSELQSRENLVCRLLLEK